jgi:hypothetical protein
LGQRQDFDIRLVQLSAMRKVSIGYQVVVSFENMGERNINRIDFEKIDGKWYLKDMRNEQPGAQTGGLGAFQAPGRTDLGEQKAVRRQDCIGDGR